MNSLVTSKLAILIDPGHIIDLKTMKDVMTRDINSFIWVIFQVKGMLSIFGGEGGGFYYIMCVFAINFIS